LSVFMLIPMMSALVLVEPLPVHQKKVIALFLLWRPTEITVRFQTTSRQVEPSLRFVEKRR